METAPCWTRCPKKPRASLNCLVSQPEHSLTAPNLFRHLTTLTLCSTLRTWRVKKLLSGPPVSQPLSSSRAKGTFYLLSFLEAILLMSSFLLTNPMSFFSTGHYLFPSLLQKASWSSPNYQKASTLEIISKISVLLQKQGLRVRICLQD